MWWKVQLECGHETNTQAAAVPGDYLICGECFSAKHNDGKTHFRTSADRVRIYAVEIREWKAECSECTYSRFFGYCQSDAELAANKHYGNTDHRVCVDLRIHPARLKLFRLGYGRRRWPKRFIPSSADKRPLGTRAVQQPLPPGKDSDPYVHVRRSSALPSDDPPPF